MTNVTNLANKQSTNYQSLRKGNNELEDRLITLNRKLTKLKRDLAPPPPPPPPCVSTAEECGCGFTNTTEGCFKKGPNYAGSTLFNFTRAEEECQLLGDYSHLPRVDSALVGTFMFIHVILY